MDKKWQAKDIYTVFLRLALGTAFLSAVADRFGVWGPLGTRNVGWGDFSHFINYTRELTSMMPASSVPALAWIATSAEIVFGIALIVGWKTRTAAFLSGLLLLVFGLSMIYGLGLEPPLSYSVFSASAGAFLLSTCDEYKFSLDSITS
ncbi:DoxX family protein [Terriglobus albidus]|uniref:DoxX family protein n=1 Tax=Terriglobus albidus TaxID=1592106 RepID=A0A5B9ECU2_9BACT|nr:DoxX family protein [Terriglobus albidus]QEE28975.1 DoxX family protein [Terriglobus albidus]